jgi:cation diffusion facilitator family transporter
MHGDGGVNHAHGHERGHDRGGGHDHPHPHPHGDGSEHDHGAGIFGWFRSTFAHSHDMHEKVDDVMETHERGFWATKWALISLAITTVIQIVIVSFSGSTALFADTIHNLGDGANSIPLLIAFALQRRVRSRTFTYGFGRTEDLAGVVIVVLIAVSAAVAGYESVRKILDPQPIGYLGWVALAALVGFVGNELVAWLQIRTGKEIGSAALIADGQHARVDGFTSLAVLIGVGGVLVGLPILDPIVGLLITATILWILKDAGIAIFRRLLDGIEPEILAAVEHAPLHVAGVQGVHEARARWLGHKVHADLHVTVDRRLSVAESHGIGERVRRALADHVPAFGGATIHVCPCDHDEAHEGSRSRGGEPMAHLAG